MLEELAASSGMTTWAVVSLVFFIAVYAVIAIRTLRARREDMRAMASLPLERDDARGDHG